MQKPRTETFEITHQELRQRLDYDPASGAFARKSNYRPISLKPNSTGYLRVSINGVSFKAHRLAWFYVYGKWPERDIDHVNGVKTDNRIDNLRLATRSENQQNHPRRMGNRSGYKGVYLHPYSKTAGKERWVARIKYDGIQRHLGCFDTREEAAQVYKEAALEHFGPFARLE